MPREERERKWTGRRVKLSKEEKCTEKWYWVQ